MRADVLEALPDLLALAYDRSEEARLDLADRLADLFLSGDFALSEQEEDLVGTILDELLKNNDPALKNELATKFAKAGHIPRKAALRLICGGIEIARKILVENRNLTDADLITVVETQSRDYASAIAERSEISEAVVDALVTTGDATIMALVAENLGAKLSTRALDLLADAARISRALQTPLVERPELTQARALDLYWWIAKDLRRRLAERFPLTGSKVQQALDEVVHEKLQAHLLQKNDDAMMTALAAWLSERCTPDAHLLLQLLRLGHFRLFNILLARLTDMPLPLIDQIIGHGSGAHLAALARAIGIDKPQFVSIFLLARGARADEHIVHPRELTEALTAFDRLSPSLAHDILTSWRANPEDILPEDDEQQQAAGG